MIVGRRTGDNQTGASWILIDGPTMAWHPLHIVRGDILRAACLSALEKVPGETVDCGQVGIHELCVRHVPASTRPFPIGGLLAQAASDWILVNIIDRGHHDFFSEKLRSGPSVPNCQVKDSRCSLF
jgi:hypothetical protein